MLSEDAKRHHDSSFFILHFSFGLKVRICKFFLLLLISFAAFTAVFAAEEENPVPSDPQLVQIFVYLNALRTRYHIDVLKFDEHLNTAAQRQADYLAEIGRLGSGRIDFTVGSALDLFGGTALRYADLKEYR